MENIQKVPQEVESPVVEGLSIEEAKAQESQFKLQLDQATASKLAVEIKEAQNNYEKAIQVTQFAIDNEGKEPETTSEDETDEEDVKTEAEVNKDIEDAKAVREAEETERDNVEAEVHTTSNKKYGDTGALNFYQYSLDGKDTEIMEEFYMPTREEAWKSGKDQWIVAKGSTEARELFDVHYGHVLKEYIRKKEDYQHIKGLARVEVTGFSGWATDNLDEKQYHAVDKYATAEFYADDSYMDRTTRLGVHTSEEVVDSRESALNTGYIIDANGEYVYSPGAHGDIIGSTLNGSDKKVIALVYNNGDGHIKGDRSVSAIYEGETNKIQGRGIVNKSDYNYVKNEGSWFTRSNDMGIESHWYDSGGRFINDTAIGFAEFGVGAAQGISGMFGGSDQMDDLMTMLQGAKLGQSKESMDNQFTADNIIFMLSDLIMQLGTGKVVGNLAYKGAMLGVAKASRVAEKLTKGASLADKGKRADRFRRVVASATGGKKGEKMAANISKYTSSGYMTLNATKGSYAQAKAAGYSNEEAGAYWLASSVALFGVGRILNYTDNFLSSSKGLGVIPNLIEENTVKYATKESVIAGLKATGAKQGLKDKALKAFIKKGVKKSVSDGSIASAKSQIGKIRGWFNDHDAGIMGYVKAGASEGLEEVIEGMAQDVINLSMNEISGEGHIRTYGDIGYLQEKGEQVFLEFGLGAIGGTFAKMAFGKGPGAFEGNSIEEAVMMGMGSKVMQETLDKYNRGSLGSKTLTYEKDADGNYLPASKPEESQANMNLNIIRTQINHATMMIEDTGGMAAINAIEGRAAEVKGKIERAAIVEDIKEDIKEASVLINDNDLAGKVEETFYTSETDPEMSIADKNVIVDKTVALINEKRADEDKVSSETIRKVLEAKTRIKKFANDDDTVLKYFFRSGDISHGMTEEQKKKYGRDFVFNQYNATIKAQEERKGEFDEHKLLISTYSQAIADYKTSKDPTKILELFKSKPPKYLDKETREDLLSIMAEYSGDPTDVKSAQDHIHLMRTAQMEIDHKNESVQDVNKSLNDHVDKAISELQKTIDSYKDSAADRLALGKERSALGRKIFQAESVLADMLKAHPRTNKRTRNKDIGKIKKDIADAKKRVEEISSIITPEEYNAAVVEKERYTKIKANLNNPEYLESLHNLIHQVTFNTRLGTIKGEDSMSELYDILEGKGILAPRSPYLKDMTEGGPVQWLMDNIFNNTLDSELSTIEGFLNSEEGNKLLLDSTEDVTTTTPIVSAVGAGLGPFKKGKFFKAYQERLDLLGIIKGAKQIEDFKVNDFRLLLNGFTVAEDGSIVQGTSLEGSLQALYSEAMSKSPTGQLQTSLFTNEAGTVALLEAIMARFEEARAIAGSDSAIELNTTKSPGKYRELRILPTFINKRRRRRRAVKRSKVKRTSETFALNDTMMAIASQAARVSKDNARKEKTGESYSDLTTYDLTRDFVSDFIPNLPHTVADKARMREIEIEAKNDLTPVEREELQKLIASQAREAARNGIEPTYGVLSGDQKQRRAELENKKDPKFISKEAAVAAIDASKVDGKEKRRAKAVIRLVPDDVISVDDFNNIIKGKVAPEVLNSLTDAFKPSEMTESEKADLNTLVKISDRYNELTAKQDAAVKAGSSQEVYIEWKAIRESQEDLNTVIGKLESMSAAAVHLANIAGNNNTGKGSVKGRKEVIAKDLNDQMKAISELATSLNVADDEWFAEVAKLGDIAKNTEDSELKKAHELIQRGKELIRETAKSKTKAELDILTATDSQAAYFIYVDDTEFYKIYGNLLAEMDDGSDAPIPEQENVIRHVVAAAMTDYNSHTTRKGNHMIAIDGTYGSGKTSVVTQIAARIIMTLQNNENNPNKGGILTASDNQVQTSKIAISVEGSRSTSFLATVDNATNSLVSEANKDNTSTPKKLIALLESGVADPKLLEEITLIIFDEASYIGSNTSKDNDGDLEKISALLDTINTNRRIGDRLTFVALGDGQQQGATNLDDNAASIFDKDYNTPKRMDTNHRASNKEITEFIDSIPSTVNAENSGTRSLGGTESSWGQVNGSIIRGGVQVITNNGPSEYDLYNDQDLVDNIIAVLDGKSAGGEDITNFISIIERTSDRMPSDSLLGTLVSNPKYAVAFAPLYNETNFQGSEHAYVIADVGAELIGDKPSTYTAKEFKHKVAMRTLLSRGEHYVHIRDNTNRNFTSKNVGTIDVERPSKMNHASDEVRSLKVGMLLNKGDKMAIEGRVNRIKDLSYSQSIKDEIEVKQSDVETILNSILGVQDNLTVADTLAHIISTTRAEVAEHAIKIAQAWAKGENMSIMADFKGFASADGIFEITAGPNDAYIGVVGQQGFRPNLPEVLLNFPVTLYTESEYEAAQVEYGGDENIELKKKRAELEAINVAREKLLARLKILQTC